MTVVSSGGKIVAFSAVRNVAGLGNAGNEETPQKPSVTPILLQVSMVTTVARPMSFSEFERAMEFIVKSKDTMKDLFKKGKDFYDKHNIGGAIKAVQGVGDIIGGIKKFLPEEEDPMVKNLAGLVTEIDNLSEKLTDNFNEMKAFISEQSFFTNIMNPTSVLTMHMRDCIKKPGDEAKENFRRAYKANKPLKLQYDLNSYLEQKTTNPLKLSMDMEKAKTKATFEKWEDIISRIMAQFLILEAFATGLLDPRYEANVDRLMDASKEIFTNMDSWKEEYKKDQGYWEEMKEYLEPYILNHSHLKNEVKVLDLYHKLDKYLTRDSFFVILLNEAKWKKDYFYYCDNENDHIFGVWNKGGCNCFIYRSHSGNTVSLEEYNSLLEKSTNRKLHWQGSLENTINKEFFEGRQLRGHGFIGLFLHHVGFIQSWPNSGHGFNTHGPGVCQTMTIDENKGLCMAVLALP